MSKNIVVSLIVLLLLCQVGCSSSSSNNSTNDLIGRWESNCYELRDGDTGLFIAYIVDNLFIDKAIYILENIGYNDVACTMSNGNLDSYVITYTLGTQVDTTDGNKATRITLTSEVDLFGQATTITTEAIFRVTGVELNFGSFNPKNASSLNYAITYIKK
jgi:hypothetical protein